jgi:hypothetical protein
MAVNSKTISNQKSIQHDIAIVDTLDIKSIKNRSKVGATIGNHSPGHESSQGEETGNGNETFKIQIKMFKQSCAEPRLNGCISKHSSISVFSFICYLANGMNQLVHSDP